jgi:aspartyl-tRNA(Asn)/glutamyl-tRNA(Gln) amidotransferase subunit B
MRTKEESHDYRYFPDPDLPPLVLATAGIDAATEGAALPELPRARQERLQHSYGLSAYDAAVLTGTRALADYFEAVLGAGAEPQRATNWTTGSVLADAKDHEGRYRVRPQRLAELIELVADGTVSLQAAKKVFAAIAERDSEPRAAAHQLGLIQVGDADAVGRWVQKVLSAHGDAVARYRAGERKLFGFFIGEVMKASRGKADPTIVRQLLRDRLD